jgi:hypothetical protein
MWWLILSLGTNQSELCIIGSGSCGPVHVARFSVLLTLSTGKIVINP